MGKQKEHKQNQILFCPILGPCPTLGTVSSGNFFVRLGYFVRIQGCQKDRETIRKYDIRRMYNFRTSVPFWEQQAPSY